MVFFTLSLNLVAVPSPSSAKKSKACQMLFSTLSNKSAAIAAVIFYLNSLMYVLYCVHYFILKEWRGSLKVKSSRAASQPSCSANARLVIALAERESQSQQRCKRLRALLLVRCPIPSLAHVNYSIRNQNSLFLRHFYLNWCRTTVSPYWALLHVFLKYYVRCSKNYTFFRQTSNFFLVKKCTGN